MSQIRHSLDGAIISQNAIKPSFFVTSGRNRECVSLSIMQNKPNFRNAKMNENLLATKDYKNETHPQAQKNKPNQTQFQMPTNPSKEREEKRVSGTFSGSQSPKRLNFQMDVIFYYSVLEKKIPVCTRVTCATGRSFKIIQHQLKRFRYQIIGAG